MKVRIVGLGTSYEKCFMCGNESNIYIEFNNHIKPACNNCVGPGKIGQYAEIIYKPVKTEDR